jgi:hypothetical protein
MYRASGWCLADAERVLQAARYQCSRVISVDRDSILYLTHENRPRTAWLHTTPAGDPTVKQVMLGFVADPPANLHTPT